MRRNDKMAILTGGGPETSRRSASASPEKAPRWWPLLGSLIR